jgi:hypothetical protein
VGADERNLLSKGFLHFMQALCRLPTRELPRIFGVQKPLLAERLTQDFECSESTIVLNNNAITVINF